MYIHPQKFPRLDKNHHLWPFVCKFADNCNNPFRRTLSVSAFLESRRRNKLNISWCLWLWLVIWCNWEGFVVLPLTRLVLLGLILLVLLQFAWWPSIDWIDEIKFWWSESMMIFLFASQWVQPMWDLKGLCFTAWWSADKRFCTYLVLLCVYSEFTSLEFLTNVLEGYSQKDQISV